MRTYKAERPEKLRGIIVYDPNIHGGGFFGEGGLRAGKAGLQLLQSICIRSNGGREETENPIALMGRIFMNNNKVNMNRWLHFCLESDPVEGKGLAPNCTGIGGWINEPVRIING